MVSHGHEPPPDADCPDAAAPACPPRARAAVASLVPGSSAPWIESAARRGTTIFADVGWDESGHWDLARLPDLRHCEAFLPNAEEAMRYTGTRCPRAEAAYTVDGRTGLRRRRYGRVGALSCGGERTTHPQAGRSGPGLGARQHGWAGG
ncbi:hypothetical protein GCM10018785_30690 [Streptomyces longispororuber]|uniref:Uncharacterized protein n=1 Tax=Streptomyces longispororuber TaxID=68230 RepID=A0A918ZMS9_9ACTN|nr:hypothetical protein GCM10018785_30690 [Streptomyces longispororuber]